MHPKSPLKQFPDDNWFDVHDQHNYLVSCQLCGREFIEEWDTDACPHCGSEDY